MWYGQGEGWWERINLPITESTHLRASGGSLTWEKSSCSRQQTEEKKVFQEWGTLGSLLRLCVKTQRDARREVRLGQPRRRGSQSCLIEKILYAMTKKEYPYKYPNKTIGFYLNFKHLETISSILEKHRFGAI